MTLEIEREVLRADQEYRLAGVLNAGKGLLDKGSFLGEQTEYAAMNRLRSNQVVMRKLTAWEGPIAVVPTAFDGYLASNEFPTFTLNDNCFGGWMQHVCRSPRLWHEMRTRVTGSVQRRKRLNPDQLLSVELPVPDVRRQRVVSDGLDALLERERALTDESAALRSLRRALLAALLSHSIAIPESYDGLRELAAVA
jgi:type I restriction enzyme S subunit